MDIDLMDYVIKELNRRKGEWPEIARNTGVPYSTISKWAQGVTLSPGVLEVQKVANHLRINAAAA